MTNFAYVRISPTDISDEEQVHLLEEYGIDEWYTEMAGVKEERALIWKMLQCVEEGDRVYVRDFATLAKNNQDLLAIVEELEGRNAHLISVEDGFDSSTEEGRIKREMLDTIVSFQRRVVKELQREGIARAQAEGKYKGRVKIQVPHFEKYYKRYIEKRASKQNLAKELGISRPTLDRLIKEHEETQGKSQGDN